MNGEAEVTVIPVSDETKTGIEKMESWAQSLVVRTPQDRSQTMIGIKAIKTRKDEIVNFFSDSKAKAHAAWKAIVGNEKSFTDRLDAVERAAKDAVLKYDREEAERIAAEQRRLQAKADADARAERERLEKEAAKLKTPELKAERLEQAANIQPVTVTVAPPPREKGEATRKTWKARVVNVDIVPREYMTVNQQALDGLARATKGAVQIPGVVFFEESSLAIR